MYLDPQDGKEPMFKAAVRLLHNRGESLDPLQVLEVKSSLFSCMCQGTGTLAVPAGANHVLLLLFARPN